MGRGAGEMRRRNRGRDSVFRSRLPWAMGLMKVELLLIRGRGMESMWMKLERAE